MSGTSLFQHLLRTARLQVVGVDDVKVRVPGGAMVGIGTRSLDGCTCVVILGGAVLMAHMAPLPGSYTDWQRVSREIRQAASRQHQQRYLQAIQDTVARNPAYFRPESTAWGVFSCETLSTGVPRGQVEFIVEQVRSNLAALGFRMRPAFYEIVEPARVSPPKGELVAAQRNGVTQLYLERARLWPPMQRPAAEASAAGSGESDEDEENEEGNDAENDEENDEENQEDHEGSEEDDEGSQRDEQD